MATLLTSEVPTGYKFRAEISGNASEAFANQPSQRTLIFTRGWAQSETPYPLLVHIAGPNAGELLGTEGRAGVVLELGLRDVVAVYHDGWWMLGPGPEEVSDNGRTLHWNRNDVHSVTVTTPTRTVAVRGTRRRGVRAEDLRRLALAASGD